MNMTSVPTKVTEGVSFLPKKHKFVSLLGYPPLRLGRWDVRYESETDKAWAFSIKTIPRGEKVRLLAVKDSAAFDSDINNKFPESARRQGYFTFIYKTPRKLSKEVLNGRAPIEYFDGADKAENNLRVTFEKGGIYEFWISPEEPNMHCAKVQIEGNGHVTVEQRFDPKIMQPFDGIREGFWLMMRTTPGMQLEFLG